ncbi:carboxypeptidase-like regulatory domain-containing protein [Flavisolibacter ginsenosidimutans]|uniref:Carboxypeptidase-like regulatory domain-containing protein n=1 Tax=Flavisolibacter ginsenosidimutans TaxID=661481 RepID=A0A5B8UN98_9BACT|nr:carboxypeptidase-like regulatory domain-containing protein [Flavisolibacter ginsenosidimutans]QEC57842.1 carboxypeptidase-like regulatory domain-containing protein [Flavisolibacter ginsenosidimutans]
MRSFLVLLFFSWLTVAHAQTLLKGVVLDEEKHTPVPKASVFLSNTSIGTTANDEGGFALNVPAGKFELVVSSVGYATYSQSINTNEVLGFITIKLTPKAPELETIIIEPYEKDGWEKWGKWFTDNFIGTTEYSRDCRIKNPEALKFRNSKKNNTLTAVAVAPLQIENKALGYRITYQLEDFRYNFKTRMLFYAGFPFFQNLQGSDHKQRQWEKAREDVYLGSMLQFMRALYRNKIVEEGFDVRRLQKIPNAEKNRVKMIYKTSSVRADENGRLVSTVNRDSSAYYNRIMREDDFKKVYGKDLLRGDSMAYAIDSTVAGFDFPDYLLVIYKYKKNPPEFKQMFPKSSDAMMSEITLVNGKPLQVLANGSYFNPEDLLSTGYWGWWEKMGTMLPFDYQPPARK